VSALNGQWRQLLFDRVLWRGFRRRRRRRRRPSSSSSSPPLSVVLSRTHALVLFVAGIQVAVGSYFELGEHAEQRRQRRRRRRRRRL
jgi:hypothetical protein